MAPFLNQADASPIIKAILRSRHYLISLLLLLLASSLAFGQRGQIIQAATTSVMDPNRDGFVSKTSAGFSNRGSNASYLKEFEIPMFGIPIVGAGEVAADNQAGPKCGITDITVDSLGYGAYAVLDAADNMIFRFRLGTNNPSVEAYTILIDTDGKIGPSDPNATANNPGFEIDITLIKNAQQGVRVFNIDGIESCPTPIRQYGFFSNFQIAIADIITCSNPDYFYDFYVPFADLQAAFGITKNTELRFVALTNVSATCAMAGKIADIGGVNDALYSGCNTCAFLDLANNQCPTALSNLCQTCVGFQTGVTPKPTIDTPVKAAQPVVTGTAIPNATVFIDLFNSSNVLKQSITTTTGTGCVACSWTATFGANLAPGDIISARAKSITGCQSAGVSSDATVAIVVVNVPPVINGASAILIYDENSPPVKIDANLNVTDADNTNLKSAAVSITSNFIAAEDILSFTPAAGIAGTYNPTTGVLQLIGPAPLTTFQTLLRSVGYSNSSDNPTASTRTIHMVVNDGLDNSNGYDRQITVIPVNDPPVAQNDVGSTNEDTPLSLPGILSNDTDVDGTINPATVDLDLLTVGIQNTLTNAQGVWNVNGSGVVSVNPALNFNGTAQISYVVSDNQGGVSNPATITVTVLSVNDPPVAANDAASTNEDTPVTVLDLTANDTDVDGVLDKATVDLDPVTAGTQNSFVNGQGTWNVTAAAALTLTPALNFNGTASITYTVKDNQGALSNVATITMTILPVNDAPVAVADNASTNEDTPVSFNVAANDTDVDGTVNVATVDLDPLTNGIQTSFTNAQGTFAVNSSGLVTYTPALNFNGTVVRTYVINDNLGLSSAPGTYTITVVPVNDPPVANDDSGSTFLNTAITLFGVTGNDTDVDGTVNPATVDLDPATAGIQSAFVTASGNWSVNTGGDVTFTPTLAFFGNAAVTYRVQDNLAAVSNVATITITVSNTTSTGDIPPVAVADAVSTNEDTSISFNPTANDTDADGTIDATTVDLDVLTNGIQQNAITAEGSWTVNASGVVTFTPTLNYNGIATRAYTVKDNAGVASNGILMTITVISVNDNPVASNDAGTTQEDVILLLPVITSNDTDVDGTVDASTVDLDPGVAGRQTAVSTAQGSWSVDASANLSYTPTVNFNGTATINYTVADNAGGVSNSATITVTVTPVNDAPTAVDDSASTFEDTPVSLPDITSNDTDVDGSIDKTTVDLDPVAPGQQQTVSDIHGTWTVTSSAVLSFTPVIGFDGTVTRTYTVKDNLGAVSNTATITIVVNLILDAPTATNDSGTTPEDTPITLLNISGNDTDIHGFPDPATVDLDPAAPGVQKAITNAQGTWTVNNQADLTYTPATNFNGTASISYVIKDNTGVLSNVAQVTITVQPVNDPPVVAAMKISTLRDTPVTGQIFDPADKDPDGTPLSVSPVPANQPDHGTVVILANGTYSYTPNPNFVGDDLFELEICDQGIPLPAECVFKTITVTVVPVNRPPVIEVNTLPGSTLSATTPEDTPLVFCFDAVDPDGNDVTLSSITNIAGGGTLVPFSSVKFCYTFTPAPDFNGTVIWEVVVCDNGVPSLCAKLVATITVTPVNDAPVAVRDTLKIMRATPGGLNVLANDRDVENDKLTVDVKPVRNVLHGTAVLNADGSLSYTSVVDYRGVDSLQYQVCDNGNPVACSTGTVIIIIEDLPLRVYQGLSPNGDGINDYLRIDGIDYYVNNEVKVFDRYNNLVFEIQGYNNMDRVWRGQANRGIGSTELPEETYFYSISLGDGSGVLNGYVILKRNP
ncbi:MAG: Ig-like domain-containing protein [Cyclobacteriaceae bacterium]|nr:Ig-like domain-containing protein [Cyclobacteriaceae bacterium]